MTFSTTSDRGHDDVWQTATTTAFEENRQTTSSLLRATRGLAAHSGLNRLLSGLAVASVALVALTPTAGAAGIGVSTPTGAGATVMPYGGAAEAPAPSDVAPDGESAALRGSIVYLKKDNIWLTRGDGTGTRQVTTDGTASNPYRVPSQSNAGIIAAARGMLIVRMDRTGKILNTIDPPALKNSVGHTMDGPPTEVAISPDGRKIAWSYAAYECPSGVECGVRVATGYTESTRQTPVKKWGSTYYDTPSWASNTRTLQSFGAQAEIHDLGSKSKHWFHDGDYADWPTDIFDLELSDNGKLLAVARGYGDNIAIMWSTVEGDATQGPPTEAPTPLCVTNESPGVSSPTFAPNTAAIAYEFPEGIYVKSDPMNCAAPQPTLIVPGGHHPDWSPARL